MKRTKGTKITPEQAEMLSMQLQAISMMLQGMKERNDLFLKERKKKK